MPPSDPQTTIIFRLTNVEENVKELQTRLNSYVLERENDLRLRNILDSLTRIGDDVQQVKESNKELNSQLTDQQDKFNAKIAEYQENLNKWQIRILWSTLSVVGTILGGVLIGYITHFFH